MYAAAGQQNYLYNKATLAKIFIYIKQSYSNLLHLRGEVRETLLEKKDESKLTQKIEENIMKQKKSKQKLKQFQEMNKLRSVVKKIAKKWTVKVISTKPMLVRFMARKQTEKKKCHYV